MGREGTVSDAEAEGGRRAGVQGVSTSAKREEWPARPAMPLIPARLDIAVESTNPILHLHAPRPDSILATGPYTIVGTASASNPRNSRRHVRGFLRTGCAPCVGEGFRQERRGQERKKQRKYNAVGFVSG